MSIVSQALLFPMTARDEILAAAQLLAMKSLDHTFSIDDVIQELGRHDSRYAESTIRTHVASRLCANAADHHPDTYDDFVRTSSGRYRLA